MLTSRELKINVVSVAIWIASIHVEWPAQLAPIVVAIVFDLFGNIVLIGMMKASAKKRLPERIARTFEFFPAINIEHRVERNNAFVSLVCKVAPPQNANIDHPFRFLATPSSRFCSNQGRPSASTPSSARAFWV